MALSILNVAFEVGGKSISRFETLRILVADEFCKYLFQVRLGNTKNGIECNHAFINFMTARQNGRYALTHADITCHLHRNRHDASIPEIPAGAILILFN